MEIYKTNLQRVLVENERLTKPFIYINIICPSGTYDANIEPAKDDVLFDNACKLLTCAESFFAGVYSNEQTPRIEGAKSTSDKVLQSSVDVRQFDNATVMGNEESTLVSKRTIGAGDVQSTIKHGTEQIGPADLVSSFGKTSDTSSMDKFGESQPTKLTPNDVPLVGRLRSSMDLDSEDEGVETGLVSHDDISDDESSSAQEIFPLNPWILAKMNAPIRKKPPRPNDLDSAEFNGQLLTPRRSGDPGSSPIKTVPARTVLKDRPINQLPSPEKEPALPHVLRPSLPIPIHTAWDMNSTSMSNRMRVNAAHAKPDPKEWPLPISQARMTSNHERTLDAWMQRPRQSSKTPPERLEVPSASLSLSDIPDANQRPRQIFREKQRTQSQRVQKPFVSPLPDRTQCQSTQLQGTIAHSVKSSGSMPSRKQAWIRSPVIQTPNRGLGLSRVVQRTTRRTRVPQPSPTSAPVDGRGALQHPQRTRANNLWIGQEAPVTSSPAYATRALLESHSPSRSPSPDQKSSTQVTSTTLTAAIATITTQIVKLNKFDCYMQDGRACHGFREGPLLMPSADTLDEWEYKVRQLIAALDGNCTLERELNLKQAFKEWSRSL